MDRNSSSSSSPSSPSSSKPSLRREENRRRYVREEATSIVWSPPPQVVPSLVNLIIDKLARDPESLSVEALDAIDGVVATALLRQIMAYQKLNTRVALKFIESRHGDLADALSRLDLVAGA